MQNERIPKVIHLMWFSGDPYPPLIAKCINSWHDIVPDYQIKLWTGDMIKDLDYKYLQDALKVKKYAFACDVVRAYALYTEGGIYMDSDVFLKRSFDEYLTHDFVAFIETHEIGSDKEVDDVYYEENGLLKKEARLWLKALVTGETPKGTYTHKRVGGIDITFMASVKGHPFLKGVLDMYRQRSFIRPDGSLEMDDWITGPQLYASVAMHFGFVHEDNDQLLDSDTMIHRSELYNRFWNTAFAVHCCNFSWGENKHGLVAKAKNLMRTVLSWLHLYSWYYRYLKYDK